jgi:uncharacterized membrane protein YfcA
MSAELFVLLAGGVLLVAILYASVGHAGASGYIAVMSLCGVAAPEIKTTALALNVLVAAIATWQFWRAGHFSWALFWPFALLAVPAAFLGGYLDLPTAVFKLLLGAVLLYSAVHLLLRPPPESGTTPPPRSAAFASGGGIGLLSGLTGTGGGIFLTPLLLFMHWAPARQAAATSALFILCNSSAGLMGNLASSGRLTVLVPTLAGFALVGGALGAYLGSRRFPPTLIKRCLAVVLIIAGAKLLLG